MAPRDLPHGLGVGLAHLTKQQRIATRLRHHGVRIAYRYQFEDWADLDRYSFTRDAELSIIGELLELVLLDARG